MAQIDKGSLSVGELQESHGMVHITKQRGRHWSVHGHTHQGSTVLVPEEALFLMECGVLKVLSKGETLSLQQAYSCLLSKSHLALYQVYASLKRIGFIAIKVNLVLRKSESIQQQDLQYQQQGAMEEEEGVDQEGCGNEGHGPPAMVTSSACPLCCPPEPAAIVEKSTCILEVYKPAGSRKNAPFRKSQPGPPDFRVFVATAEEEFPSTEKVEQLMSLHPACPLRVCVVDGASLTYYTLSCPP